VPGCPPRPEAIIDGFMKIQDLVGQESIRRRNSEQYKALLNTTVPLILYILKFSIIVF
jgi:NADH-quinone oxidoreductase subunit B